MELCGQALPLLIGPILPDNARWIPGWPFPVVLRLTLGIWSRDLHSDQLEKLREVLRSPVLFPQTRSVSGGKSNRSAFLFPPGHSPPTLWRSEGFFLKTCQMSNGAFYRRWQRVSHKESQRRMTLNQNPVTVGWHGRDFLK